MSILDRTLVVKSAIPPEDTKVLWIDMSSDSRSIKLWNDNNGRWEPFGEGKNAVLYIKQILKSKEKEQARNNIDAVSTEDFLNTKEKVDVFLSDVDTSQQALDILKELQESIKDDDTLASQMLQDILENRNDIIAEVQRAETAESNIRTELANTIMYTSQDRTNIEKAQARKNIGAVGVKGEYGDAVVLSVDDKIVYPETSADKVNVEDGKKLPEVLNEKVGVIPTSGQDILMYKDRSLFPRTSSSKVEMGDGSTLYSKWKQFETIVDALDKRSNETKEKVDTFLADADTSTEAIDKLKELQDYIKNDETSASQMLGDIAQNKSDIVKNTRHIEYESARAKQVETYLETQKADKTGYYEQLSVGVADNLAGRDEAIEREFIFDQSGGAYNNILEEDTARIESIQGNSIVYNQLINNVISEKNEGVGGWYIRQGVDNATIEGNKITITCTSGVSSTPQISQKIDFNKLHTYFIRIKYSVVKLDANNRALLIIVGATKEGNGERLGISGDKTNGVLSIIINDIDLPFLIIAPRSYTNDIGEQCSFEVDVIDLTKMFGAGYEPTTAEEAERIIDQLNVPDGYNAGQLINNNTTAIKTVGLNIWDEQWEQGYWRNTNSNEIVYRNHCFCSKNFIKVLPNTQYTLPFDAAKEYGVSNAWAFKIKFYDKNKNFISAYTTYTNWNIVKWKTITPSNCCYITFHFGMDGSTELIQYNGGFCIHLTNSSYKDGKYEPYKESIKQLPAIAGGLRSVGDVCDELKYNHNTKRWEHIERIEEREYQAGDESNADVLTDGTTTYIKAEMQTITELGSELSPDYKVWDWGTEEAIQVAPSTPFKASIKYGFNAVDQIRGNKLRIEELSKTSVTEEELQLSTNAITNVYPSGDPMHMAYVAAGAVWDEAGKTWRANGRSGLSNSDVRSLYNKSDMDELLFRKLWNKACGYVGDNRFHWGKYNETTGFYELNGVWDLTYDEALASYTLSSQWGNNPAYSIGEIIRLAGIRTTLPMCGTTLSVGINNYPVEDYTPVWYSEYGKGVIRDGYSSNFTISGPKLRVIRNELFGNYQNLAFSYPAIRHSVVLKNITLSNVSVNSLYVYENCPYVSYYSIHNIINTVNKKGVAIYLDAATYGYIMGTGNPEELSKEPLLIDSVAGYIIPYDKNSKVVPPNTFWREEKNVKGINGEYIYPSFNEYLANNPQDFATAEDWQALATLAEEKGVTITTQ